MTTKKLDAFFKDILAIDAIEDSSMNGLQVDNDGSDIRKIAFATDACMETFERAAESGAGMLFVHHGLFWGKTWALADAHRRRLKFLLNKNIALYAVHLPLDKHPQYGNNITLVRKLGVESPEPFGTYHGQKIGWKGMVSAPITIEDAISRISYMGMPPLSVLRFGTSRMLHVAVVSGGAPEAVREAASEGIDLFVTGDASHEWYHYALESRVNVIAGGHYATEVWGVRAIMDVCAGKLEMDVEFIDVPTGL
ncbi:MAG: Nif3-like dinuclear metal center hexameric protein [Treponema sp.]|jgi:dinuclear metal center YbgI/SA1388 family protein|nr:Nif3-like dinuclear metal center hexameric protein [Treponema sp.]